MTTDLGRRTFFRHAGVAAAGVLAAPVLDLTGEVSAGAADSRAAAALLPSGGDDTATIQAALDATGVAELGRGTFKVTQIRVRTGQQLLMSMQTVVQGTGIRPVELVNVLDADDVRIEGGILDGTGQAKCRGIGIFGGKRVTVRGTRAVNMAASAGVGGQGFTVGTSFSRSSESVVFDAVTAAGNAAAGVLVSAAQRMEIVDSELVDTGGTGAGILLSPSGTWDSVGQLTVRGCDLSRNQHGLRAVAPTTGRLGALAVVGNRMQANRDRGVDATLRHEDGLLVDGNVVAGNGGDGIVAELATNGLRIIDNEVRDNGGAGIRVRTSQRWEVRGNHVIRQRGPGIVVHPGTATGTGENYGLVSHNQIWDNSVAVPLAEGGIRVEGTTGQKPSISVFANWYGNFLSPATQRAGVVNVGAFDKTTVVLMSNRATGLTELVNV